MLNLSKNGIIQVSRGDSFKLPLFINRGTPDKPIRYNLNDHVDTIIYFSLTEPNQYFEQGVVRKLYNKENWQLTEYGDLVLKIDSQDTIRLRPGKYYYEIKANLNNTGELNTVIQKTEFWIM